MGAVFTQSSKRRAEAVFMQSRGEAVVMQSRAEAVVMQSRAEAVVMQSRAEAVVMQSRAEAAFMLSPKRRAEARPAQPGKSNCRGRACTWSAPAQMPSRVRSPLIVTTHQCPDQFTFCVGCAQASREGCCCFSSRAKATQRPLLWGPPIPLMVNFNAAGLTWPTHLQRHSCTP